MRHDRHARLQRRIGFGVLNGVAGFVRGDAERGDRWRVVNVRRKAKPLVGRIVVVAEIIVRLDHFDVVNLRRLQNLAGRFRAGNVRARAHLAPLSGRRWLTRNCAHSPMIKGMPTSNSQ